jgi:hydroxymethylglutaryl-CoA synthase
MREEYLKTWGYFSPRGIEEKSVPDFDEDPITMSVEAASNALKNSGLEASEMDAVYFASTSPPYAEKQNASTIATALGCRSDTATLDVTCSTRAGVSALLGCLDFVGSERGKVGLVVAGDSPLGDPGAALEHQFGAGAAGMILGRRRAGASIDGSLSIMGESIGERFRRNGDSFVTRVDVGPYHEVMLDEVITSSVRGILGKLARSAKDYDWLVLQGVDDARALELSKRLGFDDTKMTRGTISARVGDTGAASPLLALARILESALPGQRVILCSYGPGSGADAVSFAIEKEMKPTAGLAYDDYLARKEYIDYTTYMKLRVIPGRR